MFIFLALITGIGILCCFALEPLRSLKSLIVVLCFFLALICWGAYFLMPTSEGVTIGYGILWSIAWFVSLAIPTPTRAYGR